MSKRNKNKQGQERRHVASPERPELNTLYLAGPMRRKPHFNFPTFNEAAHDLRCAGYRVFNPAERDTDVFGEQLSSSNPTGDERMAELHHGFSLREALAADTEFIALHAQGIALLPDWEQSSGVRAEIALAVAIGIPVETVDFWLGQRDTSYEGLLAPSRIEAPDGGEPVNGCNEEPTMGWKVGQTADEVMSVSSSGAMKGTKLARYDLIPAALEEVAKHYGRTAHKYPPGNWRKGYEWSKSYAALMRHVTAWWNGEDNDPELDSPHLAAVAWHALTLLEFARTHLEMDDRPHRLDSEPSALTALMDSLGKDG